MRAHIVAGALAVALWGASARAEDTTSTTTSTRLRSDQTDTSVPSTTTTPTPPTNENNGTVEATPPNGTTSSDALSSPTPGVLPGEAPTGQTAAGQTEITTVTEQKTSRESTADMRGLTVLLGGGVEGYTGSLASAVNPGPTWGVSATLRPSKVLGIELGYSGATNEIAALNGVGEARGADIIRNGGRALATFGLTAAPIQPYLGVGVGFDHYTIRNRDARFKNDTSGSIPVGLGLRTHFGHFTADARAGYSVLFNSAFSNISQQTSILGVNALNSGRWSGTLSVGGTF